MRCVVVVETCLVAAAAPVGGGRSRRAAAIAATSALQSWARDGQTGDGDSEAESGSDEEPSDESSSEGVYCVPVIITVYCEMVSTVLNLGSYVGRRVKVHFSGVTKCMQPIRLK